MAPDAKIASTTATTAQTTTVSTGRCLRRPPTGAAGVAGEVSCGVGSPVATPVASTTREGTCSPSNDPVARSVSAGGGLSSAPEPLTRLASSRTAATVEPASMARSTIPVEARCGSNATLTTARDPSSNDTTTGGSAAATGGSVATSTVTAPRARPWWPCTPSHSSAADLLAASPVSESTSTTWSASASSPGRTAAASSAPTSTTTTFSSPTAAAAVHASNGASGSTARTVGRCGSVPVPPGEGGGSSRAARPPAYGVASTTATRSGCSAASASPSSTAVVVAPTSSRSAATTIRRGRSRARAGLIQLLTGSALPTAGTSLAARSPTLVIGPASPPAPAPAADRRYREPGEGATAVRRAQAPTATTRLGGRVTTRRRPWAGSSVPV